MSAPDKKLRGFAHLKHHNPELFAEVARKGGKSVAPENRSFSRSSELAIRAGRKGGKAQNQNKTA